jgi:hypothetical protein
MSLVIALLIGMLFIVPRPAHAQTTQVVKDSTARAQLNIAASKLANLLPPSMYPTYFVAQPPYCLPNGGTVLTETQYAGLARMRRDTVFYVAPRKILAVGDSMQLAILCFAKDKATATLAVSP